ncbi:MAG: FAD-binding oxidoreductase [Desulfobacteraceae bacterium]|jgi:FAD/FMN-containing dehydrogenase
MDELMLKTTDGGMTVISSDAVGALQKALRGEIVTARDSSYDSLRSVWNGLIDKKPGALIRCTGVADVMAAVRFAGDHGLSVFVRGGGHNVAGACLADNGLTLDLAPMRQVQVDPQKRTALVQGGARLGDLDHETQAFGLAAPVGVVSATGVAGLTLHGGIGWLLRKHGLSIDNLLAVEIVTADGELKKADASRNADLFWAVRGGGGNFGVVTAFEFQLHPVGPRVWMSAPIYPLERAPEVMRVFRDYLAQAPDDLMGLGVFWSAPEAPEVPRQWHGAPVVILMSCYSGPFERGEAAIAPLRRIGGAIADLSGPMRWTDLQKFLDADYPDGGFYYWKSIYLDRLDDAVIRLLSRHTTARPSHLSSIDVWTLGRAMERVKPSESAFYKRDAPYLIGIEANWQNRPDADANIAWARSVFEDLQPFTRGGDYLNFPGFFEDQDRQLRGAYGPNLERLRAIKAQVDPANRFHGALPIAPAG